MDIQTAINKLINNTENFFWPIADSFEHKEIHLGIRHEVHVIFAKNSEKVLIQRVTGEEDNNRLLSDLRFSSETNEYKLIEKLIEKVETLQKSDEFKIKQYSKNSKLILDTRDFINQNFTS